MAKKPPLQQSEIVLYTTPNGDVKLEVFLQGETMWLTQKIIAELFGVEIHTINYHLKEIFKSGELEENSVEILKRRTEIEKSSIDPFDKLRVNT